MRRTEDTPRLKIVPIPPHGITFEGSEVVLDRDGVPIAVFNNPKHARILFDALNTGVSGAALTAKTFLSRAELATLNDAIAALRFLATNDRPSGGEQPYNYAWLMDRYERLRALRDRNTPPPAFNPDAPVEEALKAEGLKAGDVLGTLKVGTLKVGGKAVGEVLGVAFNVATGETREVHADDLPPEVRKAFEEMGFDKADEVKPTDDDDDDEGGFEVIGDVFSRIIGGMKAAMVDDNRRLIMSNAVKDRVKTIGVEAVGLPWDAGRVYKAGDSASHEGVLWTFWPQHGEDPEKDVYGFGFNGIEPGSEHPPEWWIETASDFDLTRCDCVGCQISANAAPHLKAQRDAIDAASAEKAEEALKAAEPALTADDWQGDKRYVEGDRVAYGGQVWEADCPVIYNEDFTPGGEKSENWTINNDGKPAWRKVENTTDGLAPVEKTT